MITNETNELNYLFGGYFSARGKIVIRKKLRKRSDGRNNLGGYELYINICFDDLKIAKLFQENFGGDIKRLKRSNLTRKRKEISQTFKIKRNVIWRIGSGNVMDFLTAIEPYIIEKRIEKQIKIAKEYYRYQQKHYSGQTDKVRKQKHKYYLQMRWCPYRVGNSI